MKCLPGSPDSFRIFPRLLFLVLLFKFFWDVLLPQFLSKISYNFFCDFTLKMFQFLLDFNPFLPKFLTGIQQKFFPWFLPELFLKLVCFILSKKKKTVVFPWDICCGLYRRVFHGFCGEISLRIYLGTLLERFSAITPVFLHGFS